MLLLCYPKCSTCKKAVAFLDSKGIPYQYRDIKLQNPTKDELKAWHQKSGLPLSRFYSTSGLLYRELNIKEKRASMTEEEQYALLSTDGMLVKRPLLVTEDAILVGFDQEEWEAFLKR